jgi:hypothetical protein
MCIRNYKKKEDGVGIISFHYPTALLAHVVFLETVL